MPVTMVKKILAGGEPCAKCAQAEELLKARGLWDRIDQVVWAIEGDAQSPGMQLAAELGVALAPFFVVRDDRGQRVHTSVLKLIKEELAPSPPASSTPHDADDDLDAVADRLVAPAEILRWGLERFGRACTIAFSGAEDVALIDMAVKTGLPFSVFCLDTGRLHPETLRFIDRVRQHYGIEIDVVFPDRVRVEELVKNKGLFSFYDDGHGECCGIRKVESLKRVLSRHRAWVTGLRRDQSPTTRSDIRTVERDAQHTGVDGPLVKLNPIANWTLADVWAHIRDNDVPYNELHDRGFVSIGCEPCTRATRPGEHERAGRWWWEEATQRECGLHVDKTSLEARPKRLK